MIRKWGSVAETCQSRPLRWFVQHFFLVNPARCPPSEVALKPPWKTLHWDASENSHAIPICEHHVGCGEPHGKYDLRQTQRSNCDEVLQRRFQWIARLNRISEFPAGGTIAMECLFLMNFLMVSTANHIHSAEKHATWFRQVRGDVILGSISPKTLVLLRAAVYFDPPHTWKGMYRSFLCL